MILIEEQPIVIQKDKSSALVNVIKVSDFRREFSPTNVDKNTLYVSDKDQPQAIQLQQIKIA